MIGLLECDSFCLGQEPADTPLGSRYNMYKQSQFVGVQVLSSILGGETAFFFTLGEDEPNLTIIFFRWVETQPPTTSSLLFRGVFI